MTVGASQPAPVNRERAEQEADEELDELEQAEPVTPGDNSPFDGTDEVDVDLAETDIGDPVGDEPSEGVSESPFDGTDDAPFDDIESDFEDSFAADDDAVEDAADDEQFIETIINEGAARTAVVGLPNEFEVNGESRTKAELEEEFQEVFETFRLGRYGSEVFEEYLQIEDDNIDPIWGFTASVFLCAMLVLWMRPDGTEMFTRAVGKARRRNA